MSYHPNKLAYIIRVDKTVTDPLVAVHMGWGLVASRRIQHVSPGVVMGVSAP